MTALELSWQGSAARVSRWFWVWLAALGATALLWYFDTELPWFDDYPKDWIVPLAKYTTIVMSAIKNNISGVTRFISNGILNPVLQFLIDLLAQGFKIGRGPDLIELPRLSWVGIVGTFALAGYALGNWRLAALSGGCFLYIALFGQWDSAMTTLASIIMAVPIGVALGLLVGIWGYRSPRLRTYVIDPLLDLMQTIPTFAYLVPILLLFGTNPVSGMVATIIFAMPPMVRATMLALQQVPAEIGEFGTMAGCTRRQRLWRILMPSARPLLMVGVNQVIMMSLNMVIIASMIGAGGLGYDVLLALRALKIGASLEAGLAIVVIAIVLDRLSQAAVHTVSTRRLDMRPFWQRYPFLFAAIALVVITTLASFAIPPLNRIPEGWTVTLAPYAKQFIDWININYYDYIETFRVALLLNVLNPVRDLLVDLPWFAVVGLIGVAGWQFGGWRLSLLTMSLTTFCALVGLWDKTMNTVYLVGVSVVISCLIGVPLGIWSARSRIGNRILTPVVDLLQTIPAFVYLIPVVMLFRVGDVSAMIAIVAYAVAPAIRYTDHGIRQVSPQIVEAAKVAGCTRSQILFRVQLPLALPEIMLGVNQVIMLAIAMDIIAAMVGTRDLGQEVFISLAKADVGRGIIAGLCVAFIGIVADRLVGGWSRKLRQRFGMVG
ncbi:MAG: ABC transporter permease subunit [Dongiaceae bacterium]